MFVFGALLLTSIRAACDGEKGLSCATCQGMTAFGYHCNYCRGDGRCEDDLTRVNPFTSCSGGWAQSPSDCVPIDYKYDCERCAGACNTGCTKKTVLGVLYCVRGETTVIDATCKTNATPDNCCKPTPRPTPKPPVTQPPRPVFSATCQNYTGSCGDAAAFCTAKAAYLSCATKSDRCADYGVLSQQFDGFCASLPKCECDPVPNPCLSDQSAVVIKCKAPGVIMDNCGHCTNCDCEERCCTAKCAAKSMGVLSHECEENNDLTFADCRCGGTGTAGPVSPGAPTDTNGAPVDQKTVSAAVDVAVAALPTLAAAAAVAACL